MKTVEEWNQVHPPELIVVMSMFPDKSITLFGQAVRDKDTVRERDGIF